MKILLTGASSFTGYWFARSLSAAGHDVIAPLRGALADYTTGVRAERVRRLAEVAEPIGSAPFGGERFMRVIRGGRFDMLCHHAARVGDYRSPEFDIAAALSENTHNLREVLAALAAGGVSGCVLTGSVFEQDEGAGSPPMAAFSPYAVSKGLTAQVFAWRCREAGVPLGKFVIPNPFGPLEEPRFCNYLVRCWKQGAAARVNTPDYVRDNIHVDLLGLAYAKFVASVAGGAPWSRLNPSGYIETQGRFAQRFAAAMRPRLSLSCAIDCAEQAEFAEPLSRVNTEPAMGYVSGWSEQAAWEAVADGYR